MHPAAMRLTGRQTAEVAAAWAVLLFRAFVVPLTGLAFDWMALLAGYWIYCVFGQGRRSWTAVTALLAAWLAVLQVLALGRPA